MSAAIENMLAETPPAWVRKLEARVISAVFVRALGVKVPSLRNCTADEALAVLQAFTAVHLAAACNDGREQACRQELGDQARRLGELVRRMVPLDSDDRVRLVRYFYRGIGIELAGSMPGALRFGPCSFAKRYSPECCRLMSAFDEGFICGMLGLDGPLTFTCRLTEGAACCRAHLS